jgi:hypothetical protein
MCVELSAMQPDKEKSMKLYGVKLQLWNACPWRIFQAGCEAMCEFLLLPVLGFVGWSSKSPWIGIQWCSGEFYSVCCWILIIIVVAYVCLGLEFCQMGQVTDSILGSHVWVTAGLGGRYTYPRYLCPQCCRTWKSDEWCREGC